MIIGRGEDNDCHQKLLIINHHDRHYDDHEDHNDDDNDDDHDGDHISNLQR